MLTTQEAKSPANAQTRLANLIDSLSKGKILTIVIETVSLCNLSCNFCDAHSGRSPQFKKHAGFMSNTTWNLFLDSLEDYKDKYGPLKMLQFYGNGEPLLDKLLEQRISEVTLRNLVQSTRIITNGTLLFQDRVRSLLDSGLSEIHVSLDIMNNERYAEVKHLDACAKVKANVRNAIELIEAAQTTQLFIKYFKGGESHGYGIQGEDGEEVEKCFMLDAMNSDFIHLKSQQLVDTGIGHLDGKCSFSKPCEIPFYLLYVRHDGSVSACCTDVFDALNVGNLKASSLLSILSSPELASIRLKHLLGKSNEIPLCAGCGNRTIVDISELPSEILSELELALSAVATK